MHVKCTVIHLSDCINRVTVVVSSAGRQRATGPNELAYSAGDKDCRSGKAAAGQLRPPLTECRQVVTRRSAPPSKHNVELQTPLFFFMDMARKYLDFYTYVCVYTYIIDDHGDKRFF